MKRVTGIGGIFFKADDPEKLLAWYDRHLGVKGKPDEGVMFTWREEEDTSKRGQTVWAPFPRDTTYFGTGRASFMVNYRVDDLDGLLQALEQEGVEIDPHREDHSYGRFAWITDLEGNRVELWEPPEGE